MEFEILEEKGVYTIKRIVGNNETDIEIKYKDSKNIKITKAEGVYHKTTAMNLVENIKSRLDNNQKITEDILFENALSTEFKLIEYMRGYIEDKDFAKIIAKSFEENPTTTTDTDLTNDILTVNINISGREISMKFDMNDKSMIITDYGHDFILEGELLLSIVWEEIEKDDFDLSNLPKYITERVNLISKTFANNVTSEEFDFTLLSDFEQSAAYLKDDLNIYKDNHPESSKMQKKIFQKFQAEQKKKEQKRASIRMEKTRKLFDGINQ